MHPRYIPTIDQFRGRNGAYDRFLLEHREPSRLGESAFRVRSRSDRARPAAACGRLPSSAETST